MQSNRILTSNASINRYHKFFSFFPNDKSGSPHEANSFKGDSTFLVLPTQFVITSCTNSDHKSFDNNTFEIYDLLRNFKTSRLWKLRQQNDELVSSSEQRFITIFSHGKIFACVGLAWCLLLQTPKLDIVASSHASVGGKGRRTPTFEFVLQTAPAAFTIADNASSKVT